MATRTQHSTGEETVAAQGWTTVIQPSSGWFDIHLGELWRCRELIFIFAKRDFMTIYKQTVLGPLWFLIQPLAHALVFTVVFGNIARIPTDGLPPFLFYMVAVTTWNFFANCVTGTSNTFLNNLSILGKIYFPRLVIPASVTLTNTFTFLNQFALFLCFLAYFRWQGAPVEPNWLVLLTPLLLVQMAALGVGVGTLISSLTTRYRDLTFALSFVMQLWMYATPIVYPMSQVPENWRWIFVLNPMTGVVELMRFAFLGVGTVNLAHYALSLALTAAVLVTGVVMFSRAERTFLDTI